MADIDRDGADIEAMKGFHIPLFLRRETLPPIDDARLTQKISDTRIAWLAERGLRAHPQVLANRQHCMDFVENRVARFETERFQRGGFF